MRCQLLTDTINFNFLLTMMTVAFFLDRIHPRRAGLKGEMHNSGKKGLAIYRRSN